MLEAFRCNAASATITTMEDYEGRHEVEQSLADVEHQLACVQDYLGLDARHPRVKDFIKCVTEFSPWVKEELEKIAELKGKKKSLEEKMDQLAVEGFKIRLSRRFTQPEMAQRAKEVRDLGAQVIGLNERINSITANIHDKAGGVSELLEDATQFSYQAPVVSNNINVVNSKVAGRTGGATAGSGRPAGRGSTPSSSSATGLAAASADRDHSTHNRKKRKTSGQLDSVAETSNKRDSSSSAANLPKASSSAALPGLGNPAVAGALPVDPAEPLYCLCRQVSYGEMIACDNPLCKFEWFHFRCVKITEQPVGKWYCPLCSEYMTKLNGFFDQYTSSIDTTVADNVLREYSSNKHGGDGGDRHHQHSSSSGRPK